MDVSHLHEFQLTDGRRVGSVEDDLDDVALVDERTLSLGAVLDRIGTTFAYVFDIGERWEHECTYLRDADLEADFGGPPAGIVPIFGWGSIPDQYGQAAPDPDEDE